MMCFPWTLLASFCSQCWSGREDQPTSHRCLWHQEQSARIYLHSELEPLMTQLKWNPQAPKSGQKSYRFCKSEHEAVEVALPFPSFLDCPTAVLEDFVSKLVAVHGAEQNVFFVRNYSEVHPRLTDSTAKTSGSANDWEGHDIDMDDPEISCNDHCLTWTNALGGNPCLPSLPAEGDSPWSPAESDIEVDDNDRVGLEPTVSPTGQCLEWLVPSNVVSDGTNQGGKDARGYAEGLLAPAVGLLPDHDFLKFFHH